MVAPTPALAFDLDGTLVDSLEDLTCALNLSMSDRVDGSGSIRTFSADTVRRMIGRGARHLVTQALAHEQSRAPVAQEIDAALEAFRRAYADVYLQNTRPYAGIPELLDELREAGWRLCVTTNKPAAMARQLIDTLLPGRFDCVLGPEDAGAHKPEPAMLWCAQARLGRPLLGLVGDSIIDVETAARAGIPAIAVLWGLGEDSALHGAHVHRAGDVSALGRAIRTLWPTT